MQGEKVMGIALEDARKALGGIEMQALLEMVCDLRVLTSRRRVVA
jgi:hypothetical protein